MAKRVHKRGLKIPAKLLSSGILILIQIGLVSFITFYLPDWSIPTYLLMKLFGLIVVYYIVNRKSNPNYKVMWIVFILLLPLFGAVAFLLWGSGRMLPAIKKRMATESSLSREYLCQNPDSENSLKHDDAIHSRQSTLIRSESGYPVYENTEVEYLSPGEKFFPRMLEELKKAKRYIFIEFFILADGYMWNEIHKILKQKIAEGVEVKVIFDDFGSISRQYKGFTEKLQQDEIEVSIFNPIRPSVDIFLNNRNHRKIVVIDGIVSMTGGINIADEYINKIERFGYWMDCAAIFKGEATRSFVVMFCNIWNCLHPDRRINIAKYLTTVSYKAEGYVQPFPDDPLDNNNPAEGLYRSIINSSQKYVHIVSPYLIVDNTMLQELCDAARSGIDIKIITPGTPDKWYVHPVTQYYYEELLEAGVRIFEYKPGFIHSKIFVSDDSVATVGTVNMDYRSFYLHFECCVWICKNPVIGDMEKHFNELIEDSREIKYEQWKKRPLGLRFKQNVLHLLAPFM